MFKHIRGNVPSYLNEDIIINNRRHSRAVLARGLQITIFTETFPTFARIIETLQVVNMWKEDIIRAEKHNLR